MRAFGRRAAAPAEPQCPVLPLRDASRNARSILSPVFGTSQNLFGGSLKSVCERGPPLKINQPHVRQASNSLLVSE